MCVCVCVHCIGNISQNNPRKKNRCVRVACAWVCACACVCARVRLGMCGGRSAASAPLRSRQSVPSGVSPLPVKSGSG